MSVGNYTILLQHSVIYAGSSHSTCKMITIIVSVLNEIKRLVCLFHSDSHILIDQGTNIVEITKMGEI